MAVSRSRDEDQQLGSTLDSRLHHGRDPTIHAVRHPPIELAGLRPRDRLHPDRRIDFLRSASAVAVVLMASAPWGCCSRIRKSVLNWIVGSSALPAEWTRSPPCAARPGSATAPDPIGSRTGSAVIVAGAIILPFQPTFAAILAIGVVPLIAY